MRYVIKSHVCITLPLVLLTTDDYSSLGVHVPSVHPAAMAKCRFPWQESYLLQVGKFLKQLWNRCAVAAMSWHTVLKHLPRATPQPSSMGGNEIRMAALGIPHCANADSPRALVYSADRQKASKKRFPSQSGNRQRRRQSDHVFEDLKKLDLEYQMECCNYETSRASQG